MGIPSDRRFLKVARKRLTHLFPAIPSQPAYFKRRRRLADQLEWLMAMFASQSPGCKDELLLIDSTPVECARSRETVKRSALAEAADYGWCASHSRYFWGFRLHALFALDGTPRGLILASPKRDDREVGLTLLERCNRNGGETVLGDKNYAGRDFARADSDLDATIVRPRRKDEPGHALTSHRSGNGSNRSSGPAKTSSPSNATAPAPSKDSRNASSNASSPSPPA